MKSPAGGVISKLLARGTPVKAHMTVGEIAAERQEPRQIAAPVDGRVSRAFVENGATVAAGDPLYEFAPADRDMKEAMRALVLVGGPEDIELVRDAMNSSAASREVAEQGSLTIKALENRATNGAATGFDTPAGRSDANTNG
jgi:multidrug efflux pump subunit AcrA (membrane-fusion protein)